jgi:hypothetical protein
MSLIGEDEIAFRLELTPAQLRMVYAALCAYRDAFGHEQADVHALVREVLEKLPERASLT